MQDKLPTVFILMERKLKNNYSFLSCDFLVKVVTRSIKIHYEEFKNANFLVLIISCILFT